MAFPNTLFPCIALKTDVSDEEYKLFHSTDRKLVTILIRGLARDPVDAINVVAFLVWLERSRLCVNAVYKVGKDWPGDKVDMLADQVLGLFEWLNKPAFVSELCCDVSLVRELCKEGVGFAYLYERRGDVLEGKMEIVKEMCDKAFKDFEFGIGGGAVNVSQELEIKDCREGGSGVGGGFVHHPREFESNAGVGINAAAPAYHPQELRNNNQNGGTEIGGNSFYGHQGLVNRNHTGVGLGNASGFVRGGKEIVISKGFAGEPVCDPRELYNINRNDGNAKGAGFGNRSGLVRGAREPKNKNVVYAAGPSHDPRRLHYHNHNGSETQFGGRFINDPREIKFVNHNGAGFGSVNRHFHGHRDGGRFSGPILPEVVVGPRMERNIRRSSGYEVGSTSGAGSMPKHQARDPIPEDQLAVLLRGLNVTEEETAVQFDHRTVFLTFSKGYPVRESELWIFFTRRFGNFIRHIRFEQVREGVQPLYALMVARNSSILPLICDVHVDIRTRYIINGKHVWAKKYVKRNSSPAPSP